MISAKSSHIWLIAPSRRGRQNFWDSQKTETSYEVDCHRHQRGSYTGTGTLLRQLVPEVYRQFPEHVQAYAVEILSIAPELSLSIPASHQTLTSLAIPEERTRFYSQTRTLRLAHGIIDFLKGCLSLKLYRHLSLYFDNVQAADPLDQELLRTLLRRADPSTLTVIIGTTLEPLPEPLQTALADHTCQMRAKPQDTNNYLQLLQTWQFPEAWQGWLLKHTEGWPEEYEPLRDLSQLFKIHMPQGETFTQGMQVLCEQVSTEQRAAWARAFIASDCTSDVLLEKLAYQNLDDSTRARWHDERANYLEQQREWSLHLGAIPYHRERGSSPADRGAATLQVALDYSLNMGYYEATVDFGRRGRSLVDWTKQERYYWIFTTKMTTSLAALGRPEEAEELYTEARALSTRATLHMQAAYATAMLYTRHLPENRRDHRLAKTWINEAIAISDLLPEPKERAFNSVFNRNGLALIETHLKHPQEALRLVTEGLKRLEEELKPGEHMLHRSVLLYNRGQVYAGIGALEEALADYTSVIAQDPYYSEYYLERGNLYRRLGRNEEALADYEHAVAYSPPYVEAYFNRANMLSLCGRDEEALADYDYILEIDPTYLDARINRASILYEQGNYAASLQDVECGLRQDPENAQLFCTLGLLAMVQEQTERAYQAFSKALQCDPLLIAAWTNRAILSFEESKVEAAIEDLSRALALEENPTVLYNRGIAYQAQNLWQAAIDDFTRALALSAEDAQDILYRRSLCYTQLGNANQAQRDLQEHLALS